MSYVHNPPCCLGGPPPALALVLSGLLQGFQQAPFEGKTYQGHCWKTGNCYMQTHQTHQVVPACLWGMDCCKVSCELTNCHPQSISAQKKLDKSSLTPLKAFWDPSIWFASGTCGFWMILTHVEHQETDSAPTWSSSWPNCSFWWAASKRSLKWFTFTWTMDAWHGSGLSNKFSPIIPFLMVYTPCILSYVPCSFGTRKF